MKYRIWDINRKRFRESGSNTKILFDLNGNIHLYHCEYEPGLFSDAWLEELDHEDYVAQRYIGIKDKNSNPIYEGDIVKFQEFLGAVTYNQLNCVYELRNGVQCIWLCFIDEPAPIPEGIVFTTARSGKISTDQLEIVGHIYES